MSEIKCPSCGASIDLNATECKYCGESIISQAPQYQVPPQQQQQYQAPQYQAPIYNQSGVPIKYKNKTVAGLLGIFLGGLGVHKFYLGKIGMGILYLVFCWTYIPSIIGCIEGIIYLTSSDQGFHNKYDVK